MKIINYQFDSQNKICVPHCYYSCLKCNDYSEDSTNHNCIECQEGYNLTGTNCENIFRGIFHLIVPIFQTNFTNVPTVINISSTELIKQVKWLNGSIINANCNNITDHKV